MLETGQMAPDFTLPDQDGQPFTLSSLRGGYVVLYFYPKDNTSGCTKEACSLNGELDAFSGLGARVVGVSADGSESHQRFIARYSLGFTLLSDGDHEVMKAYGAYGEKTMYGKKTVRRCTERRPSESSAPPSSSTRKAESPGYGGK